MNWLNTVKAIANIGAPIALSLVPGASAEASAQAAYGHAVELTISL